MSDYPTAKRELFKASYNGSFPLEALLSRQSAYVRKSHTETSPLPAGHLTERAEFVENFLALQQEGIDKGFLVEGYDGYEGNVETEVRTLVWDETEEEHLARLDTLPRTITFRKLR